MVDPKRHAIAVSKLGKDGLFLGGGRVLPDGPHTAVTVSNDIVVGRNLMVPGRMRSKKSLVRISSICSGVSTLGFL